MLGALAIITFCDGIGMMDTERAQYYIDTNVETLQQRKAKFYSIDCESSLDLGMEMSS